MTQELNYADGLNFGALAGQAQAMVDRVDTPPQTPAPDADNSDATTTSSDTFAVEGQTPTHPRQQQGEESQDTSQAASQGKVLELTDDALVRVKIDGEIQEVPYKEFKDTLQREAAWHKRQQQFAQGKRELEQFYVQQFAQLEQAAQQVQQYEQQLRAYAAQLTQQPQTAANQAEQRRVADEIATLSEVRQEADRVGQTIEQKIAARDQQWRQELAQTVQALKAESAQKKEMDRFTSMLNQNVVQNNEFKHLNEVIPNFEQNLRYQVWQAGPQSIEEAAEFAVRIAKDWSAKLKTITVAEQQRADAKRAKAKLEPADGAPPAPRQTGKPKSFIGKDGKLDHRALREAALALLD